MQIAESGQMLAENYTPSRSGSNTPVLTRGAIEAPMGSYYITLNQAKPIWRLQPWSPTHPSAM